MSRRYNKWRTTISLCHCATILKVRKMIHYSTTCWNKSYFELQMFIQHFLICLSKSFWIIVISHCIISSPHDIQVMNTNVTFIAIIKWKNCSRSYRTLWVYNILCQQHTLCDLFRMKINTSFTIYNLNLWLVKRNNKIGLRNSWKSFTLDLGSC